jgi:hypothetical protein
MSACKVGTIYDIFKHSFFNPLLEIIRRALNFFFLRHLLVELCPTRSVRHIIQRLPGSLVTRVCVSVSECVCVAYTLNNPPSIKLSKLFPIFELVAVCTWMNCLN